MGSQVHSFKNETSMLRAWRDFIREVDADIITGYNIVNFDLPYIINRAEFLKEPNFAQFSRVRGNLSKIKNATFSSKAFGTRDSKDINIEGRIQFDMM